MGTRPSPRIPSQLRSAVHGWAWSSGGTGTLSSSRIDARQAAAVRCSGAPSGTSASFTPETLGVLLGSSPMVLSRPGRQSARMHSGPSVTYALRPHPRADLRVDPHLDGDQGDEH